MKKCMHVCGALALGVLLSTTASYATTATSLSSFGGIEEPVQIYHPKTKSFTTDSFKNITDLGGGTIQVLLRYSTTAWDGDRSTGNTDRQRGEVKTLGANQKKGETFIYTTTWKVNSGYKGSGRSFCHIRGLKPIDGVEGSSGAPLVVTSINAGSSSAVVSYASTSFSPADVFSPHTVRNITYSPNKSEELALKIKTSGDGQKTGLVQASLNGDSFQGLTNVEVSRPSASTYYPKWGLYRGVSTTSGFGPNDFIQHKAVSATKQ